jgi:hypothetical protein
MKLVGLIGTAVLSLTLGASLPVYSQEQHEQQEENKEKPAEQKQQQPAKPATHEEKAAPHSDAKARPQQKQVQANSNVKHEQAAHPQPQPAAHAKPVQQAQHGGHGRIPDDRFKAHFGQEHRFHVTQANYRSRRFQYGGYSFGFVGAWPSNWLYTQDVYVVDIDGVYYLCNAMYPGVNIALDVTL